MLRGRNEVARHGAAHDLLLELDAFAAPQRGDFDLDVGELAVPAGLPLEAGMVRQGLADGFAVTGQGPLGAHPHIELALQALPRGEHRSGCRARTCKQDRRRASARPRGMSGGSACAPA